MKRSKILKMFLFSLWLVESVSSMQFSAASQEKYVCEARNLVIYLSENEPNWQRMIDEEEEILGEDSYLDDEETYTEAERMYSEIRRKWSRLSFLAERIENPNQKQAVESLFTPDEGARHYESVIEILGGGDPKKD